MGRGPAVAMDEAVPVPVTERVEQVRRQLGQGGGEKIVKYSLPPRDASLPTYKSYRNGPFSSFRAEIVDPRSAERSARVTSLSEILP